LRLRSVTEGAAIERASVVLSPTGKLEHATAHAKTPPVREALRDAARAIDRARGSLRRRDPDEAVAIWTALVRGRYTLVDAFDTDGRRFLVARENSPSAPGPSTLTLSERQVAALRAAGHSMKLIAYELDLSPATVSRKLRNAMTKLGVRDAIELARVYRGVDASA
jgi:DNA-binding NarL/FixJ family response regulator